MSDRFGTSIEIGGKIPRSKLQSLIDIVNCSDFQYDWGDARVKIETEKELLELKDDKIGASTIFIVHDELAWGDTSGIEEQLQKELGFYIVYKVIVEPKYKYNGELRFWSPGTRLIELQCDTNGWPICNHDDLNEILELLKDRENNVYKVIKKLEKLTHDCKVPGLEII